MLNRRRFCLKWISIITAYICIFLLSFQYGQSQRTIPTEESTTQSAQLIINRLFNDQVEYLNSSMILFTVKNELQTPLKFNYPINKNSNSILRHGIVVFYDYSHHYIYFQQFLWLYSSWKQLQDNEQIRNDLIVFISSTDIPIEFLKLRNSTTKTKNKLILYPCQTLIQSILSRHYQYISRFSLNFNLELARLFYWQQTRLSSLLLLIHDEYRNYLRNYHFIFRIDLDSFLMPKYSFYQQTSSLTLGQTIPYDQYTLNRLKRIGQFFNTDINPNSITISWFGRLNLLTKLAQQVVLIAVWLIKEEFTNSERLHHLTYLNYPSWYIDGIFEYATAIILSINHYETYSFKQYVSFDCQHVLNKCLHISLRDPSHHLRLSKHSLSLLTDINQSNLTQHELYVYRTVIKANGMFRLLKN